MRSKYARDPTTMSVEEVMMVYFSCGKVMLKNCWMRAGPVDLGSFVQ